MLKKLSIIITYHYEPFELYNNMFTSLNNQQDIDFNDIEILVCSSDTRPMDIDLSLYPNISSIVQNHYHEAFISGPGASMNVGLDAATGEYIWRVDVDDYLYDEYSIRKVLNNIETFDRPNYIEFGFIDVFGKAYTPVATEYELSVWNWVYKKSFLTENNVNCYKYCRAFEDSHFTYRIAPWLYYKGYAFTSDIIYVHTDRAGSKFYEDINNGYQLIIDNYHYMIYHIHTYPENVPYIPLLCGEINGFLMSWQHYGNSIADPIKKKVAASLIKSFVKYYPELYIDYLTIARYNIPIDRLTELYKGTILIDISNNSNKNDLHNTLMSIESQVNFDLSDVQIILYGTPQFNLQELYLDTWFPLIFPNITHYNSTDLNVVHKLQYNPDFPIFLPMGEELPTADTLSKLWNE